MRSYNHLTRLRGRVSRTLLQRDEHDYPQPRLDGQRILVTGSSGYVGRRVVHQLNDRGALVVPYDLPDDVTDQQRVSTVATYCDWCVHLAAHKHAPAGETDPVAVADVNVRGTAAVVAAFGERVVLASTCKAADPATVYGASKLIAERIVLNAGGRVVRFVNVLGSSGSVLDLWARVPITEPLPVTPGERMWMTEREAVGLIVAAVAFPSGRYAPDVNGPESVLRLARRAFPGREVRAVPNRRGDRQRERLVAEGEHAVGFMPGVVRIVATADAPVEGAPVAPALLSV
jgi:FlaA1/EpsC-like NDP-sugar epimerase